MNGKTTRTEVYERMNNRSQNEDENDSIQRIYRNRNNKNCKHDEKDMCREQSNINQVVSNLQTFVRNS